MWKTNSQLNVLILDGMSVPYHYVAIYKYNQNRMSRIGIWISNLMIPGTRDQSGTWAKCNATNRQGSIYGFRPDAAPRTYLIPSSSGFPLLQHSSSNHIYIYRPNRQFLIIRCVRLSMSRHMQSYASISHALIIISSYHTWVCHIVNISTYHWFELIHIL